MTEMKAGDISVSSGVREKFFIEVIRINSQLWDTVHLCKSRGQKVLGKYDPLNVSVKERGQKIAYGERHLLGLHATYVKLYVMSLCSRSWERKVGTVIIQLRYEVAKWVVFS